MPTPTLKEMLSAGVPALFTQGNYAACALSRDESQWQTHAALGLIGLCERAVTGLREFHHDEARFYMAVAYWIDGQEDKATKLLEHLEHERAHRLLQLLRKPHIEVLAELPEVPGSALDLWQGIQKDPRFHVRNLGFGEGVLRLRPYANVHEYYDPQRPPDFFVALMIEWLLLPPNLEELPCPVFGTTSDYDVHIQALHPWLSVFDQLTTPSHAEWWAVGKLTGKPVATCPKTWGMVPSHVTQTTNIPKDIDLMLSGTILHPYHPDKAGMFHALRRAEELRTVVVEGFMGYEQYLRLSARSRLTISYVRFRGNLTTRAIEGLAEGCAVAADHESVQFLYLGESEGVVPYDQNDWSTLKDALVYAARHWDRFATAAGRGGEIVRREYDIHRVASQYFRFMTFLATAHAPVPVRPARKEPLRQKRFVQKTVYFTGGVSLVRTLVSENLRRYSEDLSRAPDADVRRAIDLTRELFLDIAFSDADRERIELCHRWFAMGVQKFPDALVLRFNAIRFALHHGSRVRVEAALTLAQETLAQPLAYWQVAIDHDVLPWDCHPDYFNYRRYFDLVTESRTMGVNGVVVEQELTRLILASVHYYAAHYGEEAQRAFRLAHLQSATELDGSFPHYRFRYAEELLLDTSGDAGPALAVLEQLTRDSLLYQEALELLEQCAERGAFPRARYDALYTELNRPNTESYRLASPFHGARSLLLRPTRIRSAATT